MKRALISVALITVLAGCASVPAPQQTASQPDPVAVALDQVLKTPQPVVEADMAKPQPHISWGSTTVEYFGDAAVFLGEVAKQVGVSFRVTGPQPGMPIFVRVQSKDEDLTEVLRRVALQLGGRADVVLRNDAIELHYRPMDANMR